MLSFLNSWMFSLSSVEDFWRRLCYHFSWCTIYVIIFEALGVIFLGCGIIFYCVIIYVRIYFMLSFDVIKFANVIIFVLSSFLKQDGCYYLCYHLMLSLFVIISPLFSFSWKRDTLGNFWQKPENAFFWSSFKV